MMVEIEDSTSIESTATATNDSACRHIEKDNGLEMHGTEDETSPAGNEILLPAVDGQDKRLSMLTVRTVTDNVCFFYIADYLKKHNALGEEYAIIKIDCALLFRAVPLNDQDEAVSEKWHLIGQ
jgi:hypothetical protein